MSGRPVKREWFLLIFSLTFVYIFAGLCGLFIWIGVTGPDGSEWVLLILPIPAVFLFGALLMVREVWCDR